MKKIIFLLFALIMCFSSSCVSDTGSSTIRAGIIAEEFVKNDVLSPDDLTWDLVGVDETGTNEYHAVANIKTLNGLGMSVPRKVSVRLRYNDGDWTDPNNWTLISIKYLNESTGLMQ